MIIDSAYESASMPSFQYFQNQPDQKSQKSKFPNDSLSLSVVLQYAETARKQSFEAFCRTQPLVKTYREKVAETLQAMVQAGSKLGETVEIPAAYAAAFSLVKESFEAHLAALDDWISAVGQNNESQADTAMASARQSGHQLESALEGLSTKS
jgi:hypothetical protein